MTKTSSPFRFTKHGDEYAIETEGRFLGIVRKEPGKFGQWVVFPRDAQAGRYLACRKWPTRQSAARALAYSGKHANWAS
jgi:hypothetical protein